MTISLDNVAVQQFADQFTNDYQAIKAQLPPTVQNRRGQVGISWHTSVAEQFILEDRGAPQSTIPPKDVTYVDVVGTFTQKTTRLPSDIFQQANVFADERANLARQSAFAIARAEDQIIIDAFDVSATTKSVAALGANLNVDKLRKAAKLMDDDEVPMNDRFFIANVSQKQSLLEQTETTDANFNTVRALVDGQLDTFMGFKFLWFGNRLEGGIPVASSIRTAFAYQRDSMIAAYALVKTPSGSNNPGIHLSFDNNSLSWQVIPLVKMGAKSVLDKGIVKVLCDETP